MTATAIIKRDDPLHRSVGSAFAVTVSIPDGPDPLAVECARLSERIVELERRLATEAADGSARVEAARAAGHIAGLAAADRREDARLETLALSLAEQRDAIADRLQSLDRLAAALARTALTRMFAESAVAADHVAATISRHIDLLRQNAVIQIVVSRADFATSEAVVEACGADVSVELSDTLPSGACRATCRLGSIDLDVQKQWARVAAELDAMAEAAS